MQIEQVHKDQLMELEKYKLEQSEKVDQQVKEYQEQMEK